MVVNISSMEVEDEAQDVLIKPLKLGTLTEREVFICILILFTVAACLLYIVIFLCCCLCSIRIRLHALNELELD